MNFSIRASDRKKVEGFIYREFKDGKLGENFYRRVDLFSSSELVYLKSMVGKKIPSEKMMLSKYIVNKSVSSVGLYGISVIDFDTLKLRTYLGFDEELSRKVKNISFPVLKFEDSVRINTCISKCSEEDSKEVAKIIEDFKERYSKMFTSEEMNSVINSFKRGIDIYAGGRLRQ